MFQQFQSIEENFLQIEKRISDPEVIQNHTLYQELLKKHSELQEGVNIFRDYKKAKSKVDDAKELLSDPELKEMAQLELEEGSKEIEELTQKMQLFLIPKDPDDQKNAIIEIRSGTGGDEAALFAHALYRMYVKYAEQKRWKVEVLDENITDMGGVKEIVFSISGTEVYSKLKYESGTHRVQRVPATESQGRVHTSAATVAIMPEAEEVDIEIDAKDLRIDTFRASGAGGQHVNKTSSAVRITHVPTGVAVACQEERSQFQNKDKAMRMLRAKLYEAAEQDRLKTEMDLRKSQVGSGDRSEKIRTYNYPQSRVTDHRINFSVHNLEEVINGDLDEIIDALIKADRLAKMAKQ